jgi:nicotinate-nucleotide adenylyltransferase
VVFVPAARSPHKQTATAFGDAERLELLRLLREREPGTGVWTFELERPPPSYTVETLERLRELRGPQAPRPFLILGEDQLAGLPRWREPQRVWQLAEPLIVQRGPAAGFEQALADADRALPWLAERLRAGAIQVQHPHPASGTSIRAALALGDPPPFLSAAQLRALRAWSAAPPGVG